MNTLPDFLVQNPPLGDPESPPPYRFEGVGVQLFPVHANGKKLQGICDYFLNDFAAQTNTPYRIDPLMGTLPGVVNVEILRYARMYSTAPGHEQLGYSQQYELLFSIPVVLKHLSGVPIAVGAFVPYLCVDESLSLITGREVVGFPKTYGKFQMPTQLTDVDGCKVSTLAVKTLSSNQPIEFQPLLETRAVASAPRAGRAESARMVAGSSSDESCALPDEESRPLWPYGPVDELYGRGGKFVVDERVLALLRQSAGAGMETYSFKQFRDAQLPDKACYQAIVTGVSEIHQFSEGGFLPDTEITIYKYESLDIVERLGLKAQGTKVMPLYGIWYQADFNLRNLRNLAAVRSGPGGGAPPHDCLQIWATTTRSVLGFYRSMAEAWLQALGNSDSGGGRRDR